MPVFKKILIANRGEIALRIIRACHELDIEAVAIYSEADRDSLHVRMADEAYCVGPAASSGSYLNIPNIISAALLSGVDAIHPGYGYLSERAHFAEICESHGLKFIGPPISAIEQMGDKATAKRVMAAAKVPLLPGSQGLLADEDEAVEVAREIGFPVLVKATAGGGGKGMRVAGDEAELRRVFGMARSEAQAAFGEGGVYLEKLLQHARHIEVQILADEHDNVIYLGERECSLQRRHQKVLEEAPSPFVDPELRRKMGEAAVRGAKAAGYTNAGTIEFLVDEERNFYFLEMNTRIQVEHPVTELVTGIDLVKAQIHVAAGEELKIKQRDVDIMGHAIECRINAEDPDHGFRPSPGTIDFYLQPGGPGVRVDGCVYNGCTISPHYDPMVAKLIAFGNDRDEAVARMRSALDEIVVDGISTTIEFHRRLLRDERVLAGATTIDFIEREFLAPQEAKAGNRQGE